VYRGDNTLTGRPVAIKLLRPDFADDPTLVSRFFQEAQEVNKIRHPNIADVVDSGIGDHGPFIVTECLSGDSVAAALARLGRLSIPATIAIGLDALDAFDAVHRAGILHRDLKPENVFLHRPTADVAVTVKLLDFGIARLLSSRSSMPRVNAPVAFGTADYLSPEQATGERAMDGRSDLFSLATILFELITGDRPFRAASAVATAYRVVHAPAPSFNDVGAPSHPMLEAILAKALAKKPVDRYASAAEFARELVHVTPDPRARERALQEVLADHTPATSGTLSAAPFPNAASHRSSPPSSMPPRASGTAFRFSLPPTMERVSQRPAESSDGARISTLPEPPIAPRSTRPPRRERNTPASMPAPGFCHVRGHVLRATDHFILGVHGAAIRDRILARLPALYSDDFRHGSITGVVLYDLAVFDAYAAAANSVVLGNEPTRWREIGRGSVEGELSSLMRTISRSSDEAALFRRCTTTWSRLLDFGSWNTDNRRPGEAVVHVSDFGAAPVALRQWLIGVVEQTLRHAGHSGSTVAARAGEAARTNDLDLLVNLRT
jgi:serine/threonine-protein kinase